MSRVAEAETQVRRFAAFYALAFGALAAVSPFWPVLLAGKSRTHASRPPCPRADFLVPRCDSHLCRCGLVAIVGWRRAACTTQRLVCRRANRRRACGPLRRAHHSRRRALCAHVVSSTPLSLALTHPRRLTLSAARPRLCTLHLLLTHALQMLAGAAVALAWPRAVAFGAVVLASAGKSHHTHTHIHLYMNTAYRAHTAHRKTQTYNTVLTQDRPTFFFPYIYAYIKPTGTG